MARSSFYMWGERGIIATFFADMHMWADDEKWATFLGNIDVPNARFPLRCDAVTVIIEPDFGNKGFGHPDAVVVAENKNETFVCIVEAKRQRLAQCCRKMRGEKGYNSTLKGQLELNYILSLALSERHDTRSCLTEPEWVSNTPYWTRVRDIQPRRLQNRVVLETLVNKLSGFPLHNYFHIILTTDACNPLHDVPAAALPELYGPESLQDNLWTMARAQFGWTNYDRLCAVTNKLNLSAAPLQKGLFQESFALNKPNMVLHEHSRVEPWTKGTAIVFVPDVNEHTLLHCSYQGTKCKLRDYSRSSTEQPTPNESLATETVRAKAILWQSAMRVPYVNVQFWHNEIQRLNLELLPSAVGRV